MPPVLAAVAVGATAIAGAAAAAAATGLFLGITAVGWAAISVGVSLGATLLTPKPKQPQASKENIDRLRASIDPRAPRKTAIGRTALATDIRDEEFTDDQAWFHRFIVCASHAVEEITEVWFDDKKAWSISGGVEAEFVGYLAVYAIPAGNTAHNISARMGDSRKYTGLANVHLEYKLTGNSKKVDSPFAQSVTTRITIRGKGARFYDPRLDSTVAGGSGLHRTDDQDTWEWDDDACRNPALALLFYLLGWKINGLLAVGKGIPQERIDLESFAIAANICDEIVSLDGGGTEPRYRCDGVWSEGDSPTTVLDMLKACMNADLDDVDGKLRLTIFQDDIADVEADFTDEDILGDFEWQPYPPINETFNVVRGVYTDASDESLYQPVDYPQVEETSPDGIDRIYTMNLPMVESVTQARRLASLRLKRQSFPGSFRAEFQATAWRVQKNSLVRLTFGPRGWVDKLFRVAEMELRIDGVVPMTLIEEDSDLYVEPPEALPVIPVAATPYDPFKDPLIEQLLNINADGIDAYLSPSDVLYVPADKDGNVTSYTSAAGTFIIKLNDGTDIGSNFTLSTPSGGDPDGLTEAYVGRNFSVSGGISASSGEDQTALVIQATGSGAYAGVIMQRRLTIVKDYSTAVVPFVANANDANGLTPDTPTGLSVVTIERSFDSGNKTLRGTFSFTHNADPDHKNNVDGFELGVWTADSSAAHTMGTDEKEIWNYRISDLGNSSHTMNFVDDGAANKWYTLGVRAVRAVHTSVSPTGFIKSAIRQIGPFQPATTQDFLGTVDGTAASALAAAATNFNEDNDGNGMVPNAATGVILSSVQHNDSTSSITVGWTHTPNTTPGDADNIDGYAVGLRRSSAGGSYTFNPAAPEGLVWAYVPADFSSYDFTGKASDWYYWGVVMPYRRVRSDVDSDRIIFAPAAQSTAGSPHHPVSSPLFNGMLPGNTAADVSSWAGRASVGLNSDGTVSTGKVLTGSILAEAINQADWQAQGATISLDLDDTYNSTFLAMSSTGSHMRVQLVLDYQLGCTDPNDGDEFTFEVQLWAERVSSGADTFSTTLTITEVWNAPDAVGARYFPRRTIGFEYSFDGLAGSVASPVAFNVGYVLATDAVTSAECRPYRYLRGSDERASE